MGIKIIIFGVAVTVTAFVTLLLISFHFAIAGALIWDGNVCPNDAFFSKCVQLHAYIGATWLVTIVETLFVVFAFIGIIVLISYYLCCLKDRQGYSQLETNANQQLGHVCSKCQQTASASTPINHHATPFEHQYSIVGSGSGKYNTMV